MSSETFQEIMDSITADLNGEPQHDIALLKAAAEKHKDCPFTQEIARACGRLIYEVLPKDARADIERISNNHSLATEETLPEVEFNLQRGNIERALELALPCAEKLWAMEESGFVVLTAKVPIMTL